MKATREIVAKKAGVSVSLVSDVLNGTRGVSEKSRRKVLDAVNELNYVPDFASRSLRNKSVDHIAIVTEDLLNPIFSEVINGIESAAAERKYFVSICERRDSITDFTRYIAAHKINGVYLAISPQNFDNADLEYLLSNNVKVLTGLKIAKFAAYADKMSYVFTDFYAGIDETLKYLTGLGHNAIAFLSHSENLENDIRLPAFKKLTKVYGLESAFTLCSETRFPDDVETGIILAKKLFESKKPVTAVVCHNDMIAYGFIKFCVGSGIKVPGDISVVGIDDLYFSSVFEPGLTSLGYDKKAYGRLIFDTLYNDIVNGVKAEVFFPSKLTIRDSVKKLN